MYIGSSISTSPTIAKVAGAPIADGAGKAVKFDSNGDVVLCDKAGEACAGILILQTADAVAKGDSVSVQVCGRGRMVAASALKAGDLVSVDATGKAAKATASTPDAEGSYLVGMAMEECAEGGLANIDLRLGGKA